MNTTVATPEAIIAASRRHGGEDAVRAAARERLAREGLPLRWRPEAWKYTALEPFYPERLTAAPATDAASAIAIACAAADGSAPRMDRLRGRLPDPVVLASERIDFARHPLAIVNAALADEVLLIDVADGVDVVEPVQLRFRNESRHSTCTRVHVRLGRNSSLILHEDVLEGADANRVMTVELDRGARLRHERIERRTDVPSWSLVHVEVGRDASYHAAIFGLAAAPRRSDVHICLRGDGAATDIVGAIAAAGSAALDLGIVVEHVGARTTCRERIHGVAGGRGQLTFNGRIEIHAQADGADAELKSPNLLLAPTARINAKPELEIHNRDVRCSHGATVGQIDPAQLFYLRSRGISQDAAHALLLQAFIARCLTPAARASDVDRAFAEALRA